MTQQQRDDHRNNWYRTLTLCGTIGIPLISIAFAGIVYGTKLVDKVDAMSKQQDIVNERQERINVRLLQFNELFKGEFQHLGHVVSKIAEKVDTNDMPRKRK